MPIWRRCVNTLATLQIRSGLMSDIDSARGASSVVYGVSMTSTPWVHSNRIGTHGNACTCGKPRLYNATFGGDGRVYACPSNLNTIGHQIIGMVDDVYRRRVRLAESAIIY